MFKQIAQWFTRFGRAERSEGAAEPNGVNCAEVQRLRAAGVSWRKIAKMLPGQPAQSTVRYQFDRWLASQPEATPDPEPVRASVAIAPQIAEAPTVQLSTEPAKTVAVLPEDFGAALSPLREPAPAVKPPAETPKPVAAEIEEPQESEADEVYGLDSIREGQPFFLTLDEQQARQAHSCEQPAVVLPSWDVDSFAEFPAVKAAPRIYVIVPVRPFDADTARLLRALYASGLRDQIWAAEIRVPLATVFERRRELEDKYGEATGLWFWEQTFHFAPLGDAMRLVPAIAQPQPQEPCAVGYVPNNERWPNSGFAVRLPRC